MKVLKQKFPEIVLLWTAASFFVLFLELWITGHTEKMQLVGTLMALVGGVAALMGLGSRGLRKLALLLFVLVGLVGLVGLAAHKKAAMKEKAEYAYEEPYEEDENEKEGPKAPPLAPLGLTGNALLGALAILARDPEEEDGER